MSVLKLIGLLAVGLLLFLAAPMRLAEGKCDAFAEFKMFWRSRGRFDKVVLAALASLMISFAGAKHGGTNGVEQTGGAATNEPPAMVMMSRRLGDPAPSSVPELPAEITSDALDIGLVLVGVGTDETHDFDAPASAASVTNWLAHGAATDHVTLRFDDFSFPFGTNAVGAVSALANGLVYPRHRLDGDVFPLVSDALFTVFHSPFGLGVVPVANWETLGQANRPSRVWYGYVEEGAFAVTWQNVLLGRDTASPVSFQLRLHPDGAVEYRYDLSRLADDSALTNAAVAVANGGASFAPTPISRNLTSLKFARLTEEDRNNPDRDGDGLYTVDELFVHHTDPSLPDSDFDGLSDFDELFVHHTDPLDPNSLRTDVPDGMAVVMGNEAPFAFPDGSTNTIFEHVFYTGTTNAPFAYPSDSDGAAVLKVTVRGSGSGRLVVGDLVVPLLARPPLLMGANGGDGDAPDPTEQTVSVRLPKGVCYKIWGELPPSLQAEVDSGSYTIGRLPRWYTAERGWVAFPKTKAKVPCIHDLGTGGVDVSLDPGAEITGLSCTWNEAANIEVENRPPLAARLTGRFPHGSTTPITYTLGHPDYLFGETTYTQTARFCPAHSDDGDDDDDDDDDKIPPRPFDSEYGDDDEEHSYCSCWYGIPCGNPWCGCGCSCCGGDGDVDEETPLDVCQIHSCPYEQCEHLHREAYTNGISSVTNNMAGVLKLDRDPPGQDPILIRVPDTFVRCCPCPDHWTNYVALASKSYNLAVRTADGERFTKTVEDCTVYVSGLAPSFDFDDSVVSLCKTGVVYETHRYTVLGLGISHSTVDLRRLNEINDEFGLPVNVQTNLEFAQTLYLHTDVSLSTGDVHLGFENASARMQLWYWDGDCGFKMLLDTETKPSLDVSISQWRRIISRATSDRRTEFRLLAFARGSARLVFGFVAQSSEGIVGDCVTQTISAIRPPLLPDYNRDGLIGDVDADLLSRGKVLYFWTNNDTWTGDDAFEPYNHGVHLWPMTLPSNGADMVVNGRNDLVNLCPFAVDLSVLKRKWQSADLVYEFVTDGPGDVRFVETKTPWNRVGEMVKKDQEVIPEGNLHEAMLLTTARGSDGNEIGFAFSEQMAQLNAQGRGILVVEFANPVYRDLRIRVRERSSDVALIEFPVRVQAYDVHDLYRWINLEGECGESVAAKYATRGWTYWPESEHADANVIFVHGYNVHPDEAWDWSQAMFKRLWWAGMDAGFTAVLWRGNETQIWVPGENAYVTKNYHQNVLNAFRTAAGFAREVNAIPAQRKYIIAHSLGNMLVSAARQFHGLAYDRYMMLNAAVPVEAYDAENGVTAESKSCMTPSEWRDYPDIVKSAHWFELFDDADARHALTWKGIYKDVDKTINFYSSRDEVVANGDGNEKKIMSRKFAWYNQERLKGTRWVDFIPEAGWAFGNHYMVEYTDDNFRDADGFPIRQYRKCNPAEAANIPREGLKTAPLFRDFTEAGIYGADGSSYVQSNDLFRWRVHSHGIPAESFAAGANPVPEWSDNIDMAVECGRDENKDEDGKVEWLHSYFIQRSMHDTGNLYDKLKAFTNREMEGDQR